MAPESELLETRHPPLADADTRTVPPDRAPSPSRGARVDGVAPLTGEQRERWLACRLDPPDAPERVDCWIVDLTGPVRLDALAAAVHAVRARHDALRTVYLFDGSGQRVCPMQEESDAGLCDLPASSPDTSLAAASKHRWDPERGPLARFWWMPREAGGRLIFAAHALVSDAESARTILRDVATGYGAILDHGAPPTRADAPESPATCARAELNRAGLGAAKVARAYWQQKLASPVEPLELPADRPRPASPGYRGGMVQHRIPADTVAELRARAGTACVTLEQLLAAGWAALLHRLTGGERFLLGLAVEGTRGLVGPFQLYRPVALDFRPETTFRELLPAIGREWADAHQYAEADLAKIVRELRHPREVARPWLCGVTFAMQPAFENLVFRGLGARVSRVPAPHLAGDLALTMVEGAETFVAQACYNTEVFDATTVRRWLGHYVTLLASATRTPDSLVSRLDLLTREERDEIIVSRNPAPVPLLAGPALLHQHFTASASRRPDHPAVVFEGGEVSFAGLDARANRLAQYLIALGARPERRIALRLERSVEYAVAALGVLKAGAAFVPIDPEWPAERQEFVLRDCAADVVLTDGRIAAGQIPAGTRVVDLRAMPDEPEQTDTAPAVKVTPDNLAYIIYTSGSTGQPKGVMIDHRAAALHMASIAQVYRIAPDDRCLLFHSVAFDPAIEQLFAPWVVGATVYIRGERLWSGREFSEWVRRERITAVTLPPLYWLQLLRAWEQEPALAPVGQLRRGLVGGEALPPAAVDLWRRLGLTSIRLLNGYGPTECTVTATVHDLPAAAAANEASGRVPIGRPHGPVEAYVLDAVGQPQPVGVAGELCLAGPTLARGYLGREALTQERFVPHPFRQDARMYRTGDRARLLADGTIDFCGRADRQVKVGGYRVEPGEIESVLGRLDGVSACAVVVEQESHGESVLVGYVVPAGGMKREHASLRAELATGLPRYMVPARLVDVAELPRTVNGKLDVAALARFGAAARAREAAEVPLERIPPAARDALEARVAATWCAVLGRRHAAAADDFFDCGGHSLLAIDLYARLEREFGVRLTLRDWLGQASFAALVRLVRAEAAGHAAERGATGWKFLFPINGRGGRPRLFLFAGGRGCDEDFIVLAALTRALGADQPVWGLRLGGPDRLRAMHANTEAMAEDVAREIRQLQPDGPYHFAGECIGGLLAYEVARVLEREGATVAFLGLINTGCPRFAESFRWWLHTSWVGRAKQTVRPLWGVLRRTSCREAPRHLRAAILQVVRSPDMGRPARTDGMPENPKDYHYGRILLRYRPSLLRVSLTLFGCETFKRAVNLRRWARHAMRGARLVPLKGDTTTCIREHSRDSAGRLRAALDQADGL